MSLTKEFFNRPTNITAKVICDSISESGSRITTFEIEYPRFILAELNTHKMLEKNSSSSRAIPIEKMIEQIESNSAIPLYWGKAKSGMQAGDEIENVQKAEWIWGEAYLEAKECVGGLVEYCNLHKQTANRLLEPFQMMKTVITGTDWDNFFNLRIHPNSQPEFCMLAYKMYKAMQESKPTLLRQGEWHLPYVHKDDKFGYIADQTILKLEEAIRVSASCCAQTSYRKSDDSLEKADKVFDMLINAEVIHSSPFGHLATPVGGMRDGVGIKRINCSDSITWEEGITHMNRNGILCSGNLSGWISYRHLIPNNTCYNFDFNKRMELFK